MASFPDAPREGPGKPPAPKSSFDSEALCARLREIGAAAAAPVDALEPNEDEILEVTGLARAPELDAGPLPPASGKAPT